MPRELSPLEWSERERKREGEGKERKEEGAEDEREREGEKAMMNVARASVCMFFYSKLAPI